MKVLKRRISKPGGEKRAENQDILGLDGVDK